MRWVRIAIVLILLILAVYAVLMYYLVDESKSFKIEKEIAYPVEKVFPQFSNLQNFARWNNYFSGSKTMNVDYYTPYEGQGSAISFQDKETGKNGEMYIRYENLDKTLKYQLFEGKKSNPTLINIKFTKISADRTKITWFVHTPKQPLLKRATNLWTQDVFAENVDKSMTNLRNILGNKVDKANELANIKYDSLMVEDMNGGLVLGINVGTKNSKESLFKNVIMNYNKVYNFATMDLQKRDDEIGYPVLTTNPNILRDKEISYFLGIPLSKRIAVSDNNFSFRTINPSKSYVIFYKGAYGNRVKSIQQLMQKAKKDTMRFNDIQEIFVEPPTEGQDVNLKLILPVYR